MLNETRVIPARLRLHRVTGGAAEVLLLEPRDTDRRTWEALVRPGGKLAVGEDLFADDVALVRMGERTPAGDTFWVELLGNDDPLMLLERHGEMPLPPYIGERLDDPERYQTVFAREPGSAAAPTAGLHFTPDLFERLAAVGVRTATVELVVGLDTFQPISTDNPLDHPMHTERYRVPQTTMDACREATRVVAVGTTAVRALESAATDRRALRADQPVHPSWLRLATGGRDDDELPPAQDDVADDDRRVHRAALAGPVRDGAHRRLPLLVVR